MLNVLLKELRYHGIDPQEAGVCIFDGERNSIYGCIKALNARMEENKKLSIQLWKRLKEELDNRVEGESSEYTALFVPAVQSLYELGCRFQVLRDMEVVHSLKIVLNSDSRAFSHMTMTKVVDFRLALEWLDYLLRRDSYLKSLLSYYRSMNKKTVTARGVSGPWANVDLPMQERVFEWEDIEEEVAGRERDKRMQPRYTQGYENYGGGAEDLYPSPGRYWREINNEPYSLSGVSGEATGDSPYKQRKMLWI